MAINCGCTTTVAAALLVAVFVGGAAAFVSVASDVDTAFTVGAAYLHGC